MKPIRSVVAAWEVGLFAVRLRASGMVFEWSECGENKRGIVSIGDGNLTQSQGDYGVIASCDKRIVGVCV
jgi:hypothetical protein